MAMSIGTRKASCTCARFSPPGMPARFSTMTVNCLAVSRPFSMSMRSVSRTAGSVGVSTRT